MIERFGTLVPSAPLPRLSWLTLHAQHAGERRFYAVDTEESSRRNLSRIAPGPGR